MSASVLSDRSQGRNAPCRQPCSSRSRDQPAGQAQRTMGCPPQSIYRRISECLPRLALRKYALSVVSTRRSFRRKGGPHCCVSSPVPGRSIFQTSAPRSDSNRPSQGPARILERSSTGNPPTVQPSHFPTFCASNSHDRAACVSVLDTPNRSKPHWDDAHGQIALSRWRRGARNVVSNVAIFRHLMNNLRSYQIGLSQLKMKPWEERSGSCRMVSSNSPECHRETFGGEIEGRAVQDSFWTSPMASWSFRRTVRVA